MMLGEAHFRLLMFRGLAVAPEDPDLGGEASVRDDAVDRATEESQDRLESVRALPLDNENRRVGDQPGQRDRCEESDW